MTTQPPATERRRVRILIVDDDDLVRKATVRMLASPDRVIVQAADASAALAAFRDEVFDAIVSDIRMPGLSGIDLLREVRKVDLDVPVVLMTGSPDVDTAAAAVELGAFRYLPKPLEAAEFIAAVDRAVRFCQLAAARRAALAVAGHNDRLSGDRAGLEQRFVQAMASMWMAFQPIVSQATGRPSAYEALLRTDEEALRNPAAFIAAGERLGRVHELGRAVRVAVARAAKDAPKDVDLFVNLHPSDLTDPDLCDPGAPLSAIASRVVLELTERASLEDIASVDDTISRLRALGFRIAIDDLGAGYAGLSCLAALNPDVVKLDMSLVRGIDVDVKRQRVVASLIDLCGSLNMTVVIEGVETRGERDMVHRFGCDLMQGYWFARPARGFPSVAFPAAVPVALSPERVQAERLAAENRGAKAQLDDVARGARGTKVDVRAT